MIGHKVTITYPSAPKNLNFKITHVATEKQIKSASKPILKQFTLGRNNRDYLLLKYADAPKEWTLCPIAMHQKCIIFPDTRVKFQK